MDPIVNNLNVTSLERVPCSPCKDSCPEMDTPVERLNSPSPLMDGKGLNNFSCSEDSSVSHTRDDEIFVNITDASLISTTIPGENKISSLVDTGSSKCLISAGTVRDSRYLLACPRRTLDRAVCVIVGNGSRMYSSSGIDFQVKM